MENCTEWSQSDVKLFGKVYKTPREQCWMGNPDERPCLYSTAEGLPWSPEIKLIKHKLEETCKCTFDYLLMNKYRDGRDNIGWHSDDEATGTTSSTIASISLGHTRRFLSYSIRLNLLNSMMIGS